MKEWFRRLACRWLNLVPMEHACAVTAEMCEQQREEDAKRCDSLASGLQIAALGPVGQAQVEAYEWAAKVIRADRFKTPAEVQSEYTR